MVSILIVDDHQIMREGLQSLLEAEPDITICGETAHGNEVVGLAERLNPDVIVLDLSLPDMSGLDVLRRLEERKFAARTLVLSMYADADLVIEALQYGAWGYVLKEHGVTELSSAIREVMQGRHYLSHGLSDHILLSVVKRKEHVRILPGDPPKLLTRREYEILRLAAAGYENREIAARLSITLSTVKTHRSNLMKKLDLHSQAALTRYALERGLLRLAPIQGTP